MAQLRHMEKIIWLSLGLNQEQEHVPRLGEGGDLTTS